MICPHFPLLPYKKIWHQTICSYFPLLPYKEIVWYFFKLAQSVQIYSNIKGIKEENFKFSVTLHLSFIVSTFMYILWLIKLLYNYLKLMLHWNKIKALRRGVKLEKKYKAFAEEINSTIKTKTKGHNMNVCEWMCEWMWKGCGLEDDKWTSKLEVGGRNSK